MNVPPFKPRQLTAEQQQQIGLEALAQSELQVINARTAYLRALAAHEALVADQQGPQPVE